MDLHYMPGGKADLILESQTGIFRHLAELMAACTYLALVIFSPTSGPQ
jgi:hypothetical protein